MKKLILFALSAMAGLSGLQAQTFRPFCEEGKTWKSDSYMLTQTLLDVDRGDVEDGGRHPYRQPDLQEVLP